MSTSPVSPLGISPALAHTKIGPRDTHPPGGKVAAIENKKASSRSVLFDAVWNICIFIF